METNIVGTTSVSGQGSAALGIKEPTPERLGSVLEKSRETVTTIEALVQQAEQSLGINEPSPEAPAQAPDVHGVTGQAFDLRSRLSVIQSQLERMAGRI